MRKEKISASESDIYNKMQVIVERDAESNGRQTEKNWKMWMFFRPISYNRMINDLNLGRGKFSETMQSTQFDSIIILSGEFFFSHRSMFS